MSKQALIEELRHHRDEAEEKAEKILAKARKTAKGKFLKNFEKSLESFRTDSKAFFVPDFNEKTATTQEKYSQRMYEILEETTDRIVMPEQITLRSLERLVETVEEVMMDLNATFMKYVKLLDRTFTAKVKALDRSYRHLFKELQKLKKFIEKKYKPDSPIESSIWAIDDTIPLIEDYYERIAAIATKESEVMKVTERINGIKKEIEELENHPLRLEYEKAYRSFTDYQREFDEGLSDVRKAMRKHINKKSKQKNAGDLSFMKEFVTDAATTLAMQNSTTGIRQLLEEIKRLLTTNQLELKRERKEAALESINRLLEGSLEDIFKTAKSAYNMMNETKEKLESLELEKKISKLRETLEGAYRDRLRLVERDIREANKVAHEIMKQIHNLESHHGISIKGRLDPIPIFGLEIEGLQLVSDK